jgi:hypothetical protein
MNYKDLPIGSLLTGETGVSWLLIDKKLNENNEHLFTWLSKKSIIPHIMSLNDDMEVKYFTVYLP